MIEVVVVGLVLILDLRDLDNKISDANEFRADVLGGCEVLLLKQNAFFVVCVDPRDVVFIDQAHD